MKTHGKPDHLNEEAWRLLCAWLSEHRRMIELYESFLADRIYAEVLDQWRREQGWSEFPWRPDTAA